jgi:hypothetical protein
MNHHRMSQGSPLTEPLRPALGEVPPLQRDGTFGLKKEQFPVMPGEIKEAVIKVRCGVPYSQTPQRFSAEREKGKTCRCSNSRV